MSAAQVAAHQIYALPSPERWLSAGEALEATGWTARWLNVKVSTGEVVWRETSVVAPNGRRVKEYLASSLPAEARARLAGALSPGRAMERVESATSPLFASVERAALKRAALPNPADQAQAEERLAVIEPVLAFSGDPGRYSMLQLADGSPVTSKSRMISYQAASNNV